MPEAETLTTAVKRLAMEAGFARVGIATPDPIETDAIYRDWLDAGHAAEMDYLRQHIEKRHDPRLLLPGTQSILSLAVSYQPAAPETRPAIARYARGRDYHKALKQRAHRLCDAIRKIAPEFEGNAFVDTAPVAERALAARAGLGWVGKNGLLIIPELGNAVLLAEIFCNLPLQPDQPLQPDPNTNPKIALPPNPPPKPVLCSKAKIRITPPNTQTAPSSPQSLDPATNPSCGTCRKCLDACPTGALIRPGVLDARKCLSYLTIEHRTEIPKNHWPALGPLAFGCDACLTACPHHNAPPGDPELLAATATPENEPSLHTILAWSESDWDQATRGKALRRASYAMFLRNAILAAGNSNNPALRPLLLALQKNPDHAHLKNELQWAIQHLPTPKNP